MGLSNVEWMLTFAILLFAAPLALSTSCIYRRIWPSSSNVGFITSPDYPEKYSPNICKMWAIEGAPGTHVSIRIIDLDIPTSQDICNKDYLMIGPIHRHKYCGNTRTQLFDPYNVELTTSQQILYIVFNSTAESPKGSGFNISYEIYDSRRGTSSSTTTTPTFTTVRSWMSEICHVVLTSDRGVIRGNQISRSPRCLRGVAWEIYSPYVSLDRATVLVEFKKCNLLQGDHLRVYDGRSDSSTMIGDYTTFTCANYLQSSKNGLFIEYTTNRSSTSTPDLEITFSIQTQYSHGTFAPRAQTLDRNHDKDRNTDQSDARHVHHCIVVLDDSNGTISSDEMYKGGKDCRSYAWKLFNKATESHNVHYHISFEQIDLGIKSMINVYDGRDISAPLIVRLFYRPRTEGKDSSGNAVLIQFKPEDGSVGTADKAHFRIRFTMKVRCSPGWSPCGYGEFSCYRYNNERCNGVWDCPLHGGDERGCLDSCPSDFSCYTRLPYCYTESDRCNGKGACSNYRDEMGCTAEQCSSEKGLYLCRNGQCIYEKWRCDRTKDCADNSDEENCSWESSPRVVVAAVVGSLVCSLLLVVALGCVCKIYRHRVHQMRGGPRHETPLSRQLAEMFHRRAPPPPYHEAMLTSRPYDEAYLELLNQNNNDPNSANGENSAGGNNPSAGERSQRSSRHGRRCRHSRHHRGVNQGVTHSSRLRLENQGLIDLGTLPLLPELSDEGAGLSAAARADNSEHGCPPPYSEVNSPCLADSSGDSGDESSDAEGEPTFDRTGHGSVCAGRESLIQMEIITPSSRNPTDQTPVSSVTCRRNSSSTRSNIDGDNEDDDSDKDAETASRSMSMDSANEPPRASEEGEDKLQEHMVAIDEDSDCECILTEGGVRIDCDDADTDSDTALLQSHS